jgi:hypothetical protein
LVLCWTASSALRREPLRGSYCTPSSDYPKPEVWSANRYTFQDVGKLDALITRVVEFDRKTPHNYDHRWINLHGMDAMIMSLSPDASPTASPLSLPAEQWDAIAEKTRTDYLSGFHDALKSLPK